MRRFIACALVAVMFSINLSYAGGVTLTLEEACGGGGHDGTLANDSLDVDFTACNTATGGYAKVLAEDSSTLVEVTIDDVENTITIVIDGTVYDPETITEAEKLAMNAVISSNPNKDLIKQHLWSEMTRAQVPTISSEMAAVAIQLMVFEFFDPAGGVSSCNGCCGPACWGCTNCYTSACMAHDIACGAGIKNSKRTCQILFQLAAASMACCVGVDLGPLCDS